jgi:hypothetical protein
MEIFYNQSTIIIKLKLIRRRRLKIYILAENKTNTKRKLFGEGKILYSEEFIFCPIKIFLNHEY